MSTNRREFLLAGGAGMATVVAGGGVYEALRGQGAAAATPPTYALAATDGHITLPNRPNDQPLYIFGFREVPVTTDVQSLVSAYKGKAQHTAPMLDFKEGDDIKITLTNLGLVARPDLTDAHTIHWHGFRTPVALFDGVPEVSIAVPLQRQFTYFYRPHAPGTYMYHCHMEDVEHVQMGMTGIVFVRPKQGPKFVYNDGDGSTAFDREFPLLLNEIWDLAHDHDENIQESVWTDYKPNYFTINGRVYPQTTWPNGDARVEFQPNSSLMQVNGGDRVLMRLANLGYQQHSMQLPGVGPLKVVGEDATLLRRGTTDLSYRTNTLYIGPGEARDVIFTAPTYHPARSGGDDNDGHGPYNLYWFRNRDASKLSNNGAPGLGGMVTQVRVYQNALPAQTSAGETYV
jgi:manganese oxidase